MSQFLQRHDTSCFLNQTVLFGLSSIIRGEAHSLDHPFMVPKTHTLEAAMNARLAWKSGEAIDEIATQTYRRYQKCEIKGARNLFATGY